MNTTSAKRQQIIASLSDKEYRDAFVAAEIETTIPFQLRAMRKARGWSQKELAAAARMTQARISLLENPNYEGAVNVKTLEKLASAFDVGLAVRFVPFSELVDWAIGVSRRGHDVVEHSKDEGLKMSVVQVAGTEVVFTASTSQADNYCSLVGPAWTVIGSSPPTSIPLYVQQPSSQIQVNTCFAKAA